MKKYNWDKINWAELRDVEIARQMLCTRERVRQKRLEVCIRALSDALGLPERDGEGEIRRELSLLISSPADRASRRLQKILKMEIPDGEFGRAIRVVKGVFRPLGWHQRNGTAKSKIAELPTSVMTAEEIAKEVGCGKSYVIQVLKGLGLGFKAVPPRWHRKYDWEKIRSYEWSGPRSLTDKEIAKRLGVKNPMVVTQYRNRIGIRKRKRSRVRALAME